MFNKAKNTSYDGFIFSFLVNLALRWYIAVIAVILLILHFVISIPLWLSLAALGLWIALTFLITLILSAFNRCESKAPVEQPNINPYSHKNDDFK